MSIVNQNLIINATFRHLYATDRILLISSKKKSLKIPKWGNQNI